MHIHTYTTSHITSRPITLRTLHTRNRSIERCTNTRVDRDQCGSLTYVCMSARMYACTCACMHVHIHRYTNLYGCIRVHIRTCAQTATRHAFPQRHTASIQLYNVKMTPQRGGKSGHPAASALPHNAAGTRRGRERAPRNAGARTGLA